VSDDIAIDSSGKLITGEVMALSDVDIRSGLTVGSSIVGTGRNLEVKNSAQQV